MPIRTGACLLLTTSLALANGIEITSTFDIPPNSPGSLPLTGGVDQPTRVIFGNPVVEPQFGNLTQNVLVFDGRTTYEQIEFRLDGTFDRYHVSFDLETANLKGSAYAFSILLDSVDVFAPGVSDSKVIMFHGLGPIDAFNARNQPHDPPRFFDDGTVYNLSLEVDMPANLWSVSYNDLPFFSAPFDSISGRINSIRFNLSPWQSGAPDASEVQVGLDNIHIVAIPEPESIFLFAIGICCVFWRLARRQRA